MWRWGSGWSLGGGLCHGVGLEGFIAPKACIAPDGEIKTTMWSIMGLLKSYVGVASVLTCHKRGGEGRSDFTILAFHQDSISRQSVLRTAIHGRELGMSE